MTAEEMYVTGAYLVVFLAVLAYVLIIALKLARLERTLDELEAGASATSSPPESVKPTCADAAALEPPAA